MAGKLLKKKIMEIKKKRGKFKPLISQKQKTILFIDDANYIRDAIKLQNNGKYNLLIADSFDSMKRIMQEMGDKIDEVYSDIVLDQFKKVKDNISGFDVAEYLHKNFPNVKVYLHTTEPKTIFNEKFVDKLLPKLEKIGITKDKIFFKKQVFEKLFGEQCFYPKNIYEYLDFFKKNNQKIIVVNLMQLSVASEHIPDKIEEYELQDMYFDMLTDLNKLKKYLKDNKIEKAIVYVFKGQGDFLNKVNIPDTNIKTEEKIKKINENVNLFLEHAKDGIEIKQANSFIEAVEMGQKENALVVLAGIYRTGFELAETSEFHGTGGHGISRLITRYLEK